MQANQEKQAIMFPSTLETVDMAFYNFVNDKINNEYLQLNKDELIAKFNL